MDENERMTTTEAASYLGVSYRTLVMWRYKKIFGLPFVRVGRRIYYRRRDLDEWLEQRREAPGAEEEAA